MMDTNNIIDSYLGGKDWRVRENANQGYSLQGLNNHIVGSVVASYWLTEVYPEEIARAHRNADFHIHDLNSFATYCCGWDLHQLLLMGLGGVPYKVASGPAKHLSTALGQLVNFIYTLQGEAAGAQAVSSFDTLLAPFVRYDGLTYAGVRQVMQEFIFSINIATRVGFQAPFSNITMDLTPSPVFAEQSVIIGGKPQKETYKEFQLEMDMINRAFAEVMLEGDACGRVFSFPIPTYNITKDFDWNNGHLLDPIWEMTAKYGIPYFSNFVNSDMSPEDTRSMCCRLRLSNKELHKRGGALFGSNPLTGSVGVVTLNLPRCGHTTKTKEELFERIERLARLAKESLEIKRVIIEQQTENDLYPYSKVYLQGIKEKTGKYWANHFSTIGILGAHEMCVNFFGEGIDKHNDFVIEVMEFLRGLMLEFQEETGNLYNLEATPGEGTSYRFAKEDKIRYPVDAEYYTNSTQLPVDYTDDMFEMLDHQDKLQTLYTGGTVAHLFLGERIEPEAAKVASHLHLVFVKNTDTWQANNKNVPSVEKSARYLVGLLVI
jgi:ribonucleoside-triphosphate reductase